MIVSIFVAFPMYHVTALGKAIGAVLKPADDKMGPLCSKPLKQPMWLEKDQQI